VTASKDKERIGDPTPPIEPDVSYAAVRMYGVGIGLPYLGAWTARRYVPPPSATLVPLLK